MVSCSLNHNHEKSFGLGKSCTIAPELLYCIVAMLIAQTDLYQLPTIDM